MQAVREEVRRVVRLAAVRKITQLSPEALEAASNRALRAAFRHVPQTELAALDSEVRSLATALASLEQQLCRLLEGRGTQAGVAPSKAALCTLHMACYVACHCSMQVRLQLVEVGARLLLFAGLMVLAGTSFADRAAGRLVAMHLMASQTLLEMIVSEPGEGPCELYDAAQQAFRPDLTVKWLLRLTA
ncbi:hypothetical protein COHA_009249 [Chlorella ohadii]|uniref:Uncharacterized protein n=1 Tax=Chlorella ohadii TaxID=2649997 RepID=A0AAD5H2G1_9CHLO|nr:hypothetical protein COHA_009249 [Chlorella ohadii]